ncbi:hypothetical protein ACFL35_00365 [Candidatus Riflebacteria bacterium]
MAKFFPGFATIDAYFYADLARSIASENTAQIPYVWQYLVSRDEITSNGPFFWQAGGAFILAVFYAITGVYKALLLKFPLIISLGAIPIIALSWAKYLGIAQNFPYFIILFSLFSGTYLVNFLETDNYLFHALFTLLFLRFFLEGIERNKKGLLGTSAILCAISYWIRPEALIFVLLIPFYYLFNRKHLKELTIFLSLFCCTVFTIFLFQGHWLKTGNFNERLKMGFMQDYNQLFHWKKQLNFRNYIKQGWTGIIREKSNSAWENFKTFCTSIIPLYAIPFFLWGIYSFPLNSVQKFCLVFFPAFSFFIYSFIFSLPGINGSFYHFFSFAPALTSIFIIHGVQSLTKEKAIWVLSLLLILNAFFSISWHTDRLKNQENYSKWGTIVNKIARQKHISKPVVMCMNPIFFYRDTNIKSVMLPLNLDQLAPVIDHYKVKFILWPKALTSSTVFEGGIAEDSRNILFLTRKKRLLKK